MHLIKILKFLFRFVPKFLSNSPVVLLMRLDNIGDYILFRNLLPFIRQSPKYASKRLMLIGNIAWKELAESFDAPFLNDFFWIAPSVYASDRWYRIKILWQIKKLNVHEVVNTVHSRTWITNEIISFLDANIKISCEGDDVNLVTALKKESDKDFDILLPSLPTSVFEFERNRFFVEQLLGQKIELQRPFFYTQKPKKIVHCISLFIGAQSPFRLWAIEYFAKLVTMIHKDFPCFYFQILGSQNDFENGQRLIMLIENESKSLIISNLCGQTSLIELIDRISESYLLISNETVGVHIASARETQTVCISNGNHFGRFNLYPISITDKIMTIFPDDSFYDVKNRDLYAEKFRFQSDIDINQIAPERAYSEVYEILKK